ncbi:MAG: hypothetical protein FJ109_05975 [Deltaproteobacteria bacterium]|nr:hypothetical protein [Deltaproteobacteria bacterium]
MRKATTKVMVLVSVLLVLSGCGRNESTAPEGGKAAQSEAEQGGAHPPPGIPQMPTTPEEALKLQNAPHLPPGVAQMPAGHPPIGGMPSVGAAPSAGDPSGEALSGMVTETMDAGGYTYVLVDTGKGQVWIAGPATKVAKGDKITASGNMLMRDFHSRTLDRTFPEIYFVPRIEVGKP